MRKRPAPPPPDILRKSGPHKDRTKYDRERVKQKDRRDVSDVDGTPNKGMQPDD